MISAVVYSETKVDMNGVTTYVGEDAYPFVDKYGMLVADGMGGSAGIRVNCHNRDIFDIDKLCEILADALELSGEKLEPQRKTFIEYTKKNFQSLANSTMKSLYEDPEKNNVRLKKSGYFGSRALSSAVVSCLLQIRADEADFDVSTLDDTAGEIQEVFYDRYRKLINESLGVEAKTSSLSNIQYYGTTLSGSFFIECDDCVEALFYNCGDSRNYLWDDTGIKFSVEDQSSEGRITSSFALREDNDHTITMRRATIPKPCIFMCMTDGIYSYFHGRDGFASNPLYMEGSLAHWIYKSSSIEDFVNRVSSFFAPLGSVDDSHSMAIAAFGYENFEDLKAFAKKRLERIDELTTGMPDDFCVVDYNAKLNACVSGHDEELIPLVEKAFQIGLVKKYVSGTVKQISSRNLNTEIDAIRLEIKACESKNHKLRSDLLDIIRNNILDFDRPGAITDERSRQKALSHIKAYYEAITSYINPSVSSLKRIVSELTSLESELGEMDVNISTDWNESSFNEKMERHIRLKNRFDAFCDTRSGLLGNVEDGLERINYNIERWYEVNSQISSSRSSEYIDGIADDILSNASKMADPIGPTSLPFISDRILNFVIKPYLEVKSQIEALQNQIVIVENEIVHNYWINNWRMHYEHLKEIHCFDENKDVSDAIDSLLQSDTNYSSIKRIADTQNRVFTEYLDNYMTVCSEAARNNIVTCSWID